MRSNASAPQPTASEAADGGSGMRRRKFIAGIGAAAAWPLAVRAQQQMPVIGFLSPLPSGEPPTFAAFRRGLAEEGYVEGKKRFTNFRPELMNEAAVAISFGLK